MEAKAVVDVFSVPDTAVDLALAAFGLAGSEVTQLYGGYGATTLLAEISSGAR